MTGTRTRRLTAVALAAGLAGAVALAGCSAGRTGASSAPGAPGAQGGPARKAGADTDKKAAEPAGGAPAQLPTGQVPGDATEPRSLIFTGTVTVRVSDVDGSAGRAGALATGAGGFVGGDERSSDGQRSQAQLVLRVPSARFASVVEALAKLGTEEHRQLSTQDVTDKVVDLDVRLANAQASVDRVRTLMGKAQTIGDIVSLESELSRREADLESLKAQKRRLDDVTALSTITLELLGPQAKAEHPGSGSGFLGGLRAGWHAFLVSLNVLLTVLGAALPWLLALGVPVVALVWLGRRLRPRTPAG
jgi:uncharacterized protein DUF4349